MKTKNRFPILPLLTLIILWVLMIFFRPVEDLPFTYFTGFLDALTNDSKFIMFIFALPLFSLAAVTWFFFRYKSAGDQENARLVKMWARVALTINIIYSAVILLLDGVYSSMMQYSRSKAKSHWGVDVNEGVIDELALIFYWFNILVPLLYILFLYFFKKNLKSVEHS